MFKNGRKEGGPEQNNIIKQRLVLDHIGKHGTLAQTDRRQEDASLTSARDIINRSHE